MPVRNEIPASAIFATEIKGARGGSLNARDRAFSDRLHQSRDLSNERFSREIGNIREKGEKAAKAADGKGGKK